MLDINGDDADTTEEYINEVKMNEMCQMVFRVSEMSEYKYRFVC